MNPVSQPPIRKQFNPTVSESKSPFASKPKLSNDINLKPLAESKERDKLAPLKPKTSPRVVVSKPKYIL